MDALRGIAKKLSRVHLPPALREAHALRKVISDIAQLYDPSLASTLARHRRRLDALECSDD